MRIVTWNIHGSPGPDGTRRARSACAYLRGLEPDLACLQEVHRLVPGLTPLDQVRLLARSLGANVAFGSGMRVGCWQYGLAIAATGPIVRRGVHVLPNEVERRMRPRLERRLALEAEVASEAGPLIMLCTHWSLEAEDRRASALLLAERIREAGHPAFLCGDLNALPESDELHTLRGLAGLQDCGGPATFPASAPSAKIDYVLLPQGWSCRHVAAPECPWSDHRPLVVDVSRET